MSNIDLQTANRMLSQGGYTCVLCRGADIRTATARGVRPLVQLLETEGTLSHYSAADKVVGKATAFLYTLLGVEAVYAGVMSETALAVLRNHNIQAQYDTLVPAIINRQGDGICPFEEAVLSIHQPKDALAAIYAKMAQLGISTTDLTK